jgi:hypothetical protein
MATAAALAQRISSSGLASSSCRSAEAVEFRSSFFGRSGAGRSFGSQPEARRADRTQHVVRSKLVSLPVKLRSDECWLLMKLIRSVLHELIKIWPPQMFCFLDCLHLCR